MRNKEKVIIRKAFDYNPETIKKIIQDGIEDFGLAPQIKGRITIKPNVVMAHPKVAPSAFTRAEFLDGLLGALTAEKKGELKIVISEKSGPDCPQPGCLNAQDIPNSKKNTNLNLCPSRNRKRELFLFKKEKSTQK
jgi:hypothetical protein